MLLAAEIIVSIVLIVLILLQERSAGASGVFGMGGSDAPYQTRRGFEKTIFWGTIAAAVLFAGIALANLIL